VTQLADTWGRGASHGHFFACEEKRPQQDGPIYDEAGRDTPPTT